MGYPSTSVIVPVRNGARFVAAALESVLCQLGPQDEILVVEDGSVDGTPAILRSFGSRITILAGERRGVSAARNLGLRLARGDFSAFLDHDDLWPAGRHEVLVAALTTKPDCNAAAGRIRVIADDGSNVKPYSSWDGQHVPGMLSTCLFSRSLLHKVGFFDETMTHAEDNDFYLRLHEAGMNLALCDVDSLYYRRHASNLSNDAPPKVETLMSLVMRKQARRRLARQLGNASDPA